MFKYEYVSVLLKSGFNKVTLKEHRETIDKYALNGYKYIGFIPTKESGYGLTEVDLIFEMQIK